MLLSWDAFDSIYLKTLLSRFILRRFCRVSFWDASIEFHSKTLLSWDASSSIYLGRFYRVSFSSIFFFFFFFSLGSRHVPILTRCAPHAYKCAPVMRWHAPLWLQLHILGSFRILHSHRFIFFSFLLFSKHFSMHFPSKTPNLFILHHWG